MSGPAEIAQRVRVTFGVDGPLRYASVLDMGRLWERLLRRARIPVALSRGFNPHPRLQFASALPVGYSGSAELLDILLSEPMPPAALAEALRAQAPQGLTIHQVEEIPLAGPAPQATLYAAEYHVRLKTAADAPALTAAIEALLAQREVRRQRRKREQIKEYDLRPLIETVRHVGAEDGWQILEMRLRSTAGGSGRPEEVVAALGVPTAGLTIRRTRLLWGRAEEANA